MVVGLTHFSLPPINENQTSIDASNKLVGGASFNKGHPHVKFSIPAQDRMLKTSEMYEDYSKWKTAKQKAFAESFKNLEQKN